ncbi:ATP-binding protein [Bifidobacterium sp. ESL0690]|uniref:AAA family ATPase n=1 Tax=Bifidobacterium sp. ESL0690 TaxID=2983214 RepID=UPI0023F96DB4|nr:ATP-binding protein [Bifidobacterium sp. ESL0690]WEV46818.1 ATP-binding protein [Bifidobacterium sp. ESL0690]
MHLLHIAVSGSEPYNNKTLDLDFFAEDQVRSYGPASGITRLGGESSTAYSQNVVALTGVNATGKTTALRLLSFVISALTDNIALFQQIHPLPTCDDSLHIETIFEANGVFYLHEAELIQVRNIDESTHEGSARFAFISETLSRFNKKQPSRKQLKDFKAFAKAATVIRIRKPKPKKGVKRDKDIDENAYLPDSVLPYLSPYMSIITNIAQGGSPGVTQLTPSPVPQHPDIFMPATLDEHNPIATIADPILHVLDDSIDYYRFDKEDQQVHIRFAGELDERIMSREAAHTILSSGTERGSRMISNALSVLQNGGYLLVDEIENSINKELVHMIINLFISRKTNPHGATLVFTTHYPELLDLLNRKDNIYFLRRSTQNGNKVDAVKYSSAVKRGELKRSEVFTSNFIGGTAPKAKNLKAIRDYVASAVNEPSLTRPSQETGEGHEKSEK